MKKTSIIMLIFILMASTLMVFAEGNLIRDPDFEVDLDLIDIRDSFKVKIELVEGAGPNGENALLVTERVSVDNSPIFHAPEVVVGNTYNISMWVMLAEDPGENGVLTHIAFSVPSVEAYFVPLPIGDDVDNSYRLKGTEWTRLSIEEYTMKAGATSPNNDFGVFLTTWGSAFPDYYVCNVVVEEVKSAATEEPANTPVSSPLETENSAAPPSDSAPGNTPDNQPESPMPSASSTPAADKAGANRTLIIIIVIAVVVAAAIITIVIILARKKKK